MAGGSLMAAIPRPKPVQSPYHATAGLGAWLYSRLGVVDHKKVGALYLLSSLLFFAVGGIEALAIRPQLFHPGERLVTAAFYNHLFAMHGTTMIFFAVMPMLIGFINLVVLIMNRRARRGVPGS